MPINLELTDISHDLTDVQSALFVLCPVCPQFSLAMQTDSPWIDLLKSGLSTGALQGRIKQMRESLEDRGIRTAFFTTRLPLPTMCLWTKGQRARLLRRAEGFDAVVVLGCDSAAFTAQQVLSATPCKVIRGMRMIGITNATVTHRFPLTFELKDATRVEFKQAGEQTTHE
jgi:hypothetical protein